MAFETQQLLTSGRLQKSDFTLSHSAYESSVSDAEVMSSFSIVSQDISPHTSRFSAYSNNSSPQKFKRRRSRRSSKGKAAMNLLEDANACDPLALEALASLSSNWLNLSFPDRTPTYTDYFVNYWRDAVAKQQDLLVDHFTAVMAAVHEDLQASSAVCSTQPTPVQANEEPSGYVRHENDLFAVSCPWDDDGQTHLDDWVEWDEWRREDDEVFFPTRDQHNYGAIGQQYIYPQRNMGALFEIVSPKPIRAWNNINWLARPPVAPEPVTFTLEVFVEPESPVAVNDIPLYYLPDFSAAAIYAASQAPHTKSTASYPSTSTACYAYAESTTVNDTASVSPSSYLSALAASIPPLHVNNPHPTIDGIKAIRLRRQGSRDHKLFQFLRMSYDQKVAELERLIRWMKSHSRRV